MAVAESAALDLLKHRCTNCKKEKPWREFCASRKWPDGTMRAPTSRCRRCMVRIRNAQRKADPVQWAKHLAWHRARYREIKQDPERYAILSEQRRQRARRLRGITPDRYRVTFKQRPGGPVLDPEPFVDWLKSLGEAHVIARLLDVNERSVRAYLDGDFAPTLPVVDKWLQQAFARTDSELRLEDLYPDA